MPKLICRLTHIMDTIYIYLIIGLISMLSGMININILVEKEKKQKYNNIKTGLIFFFIGILVHCIVQYIKLDELYCNKECILRNKSFNL